MTPFERPAHTLGKLDADAAGRLIASAADVALVLDEDGVIQDIAFGTDALGRETYDAWRGKPWVQTVTVESRPKVEALLRDLSAEATPRWRHVNHPLPDGPDLPLLYSTMPLRADARGTRTGSGRTIAFGRDLRPNAALQQRLVVAQQTMERDYWRMRHMETRYRTLFQVVAEAVLILDATTLRLEEANPAAEKMFGEGLRRPGWSALDGFDAGHVDALRELLARVRATGRAGRMRARLASGSEEHVVAVSLFRQENSVHFLVRVHDAEREDAATHSERPSLVDVVERAPDGFVVTDPDGRVLTANRAFMDLAQAATEEQLRGQSLDRWLGRTGVDLSVLLTNLRQLGSVRLFATSMRGELGSSTEVEISAVSVADGTPPCLGFTVRDVGRRLTHDKRSIRDVPRSVGQMTELVGRVPLRDIVRDTTDLIEQLCIEAALELTRDNRASAAEMLGLSRQSLYVKLRRFGLGDLASHPDD